MRFTTKIRIIIAAVILLLLTGAGCVVWAVYSVDRINVEGNLHYSPEQIQGMVTGDDGTWVKSTWLDRLLGHNSIYLFLKYRNQGVKGIPFVEAMDVTLVSSHVVKVTVYEKVFAGYVEYLGRYLYFDKDGIVVESSATKTVGIPQVTGLEFGYMVLDQKLPVANEGVFQEILSITKALKKYELEADRIFFDEKSHMTLYFGGVKINMGTDGFLDEKILGLRGILRSGKLEGKSGVIDLSNYTGAESNIIFVPD